MGDTTQRVISVLPGKASDYVLRLHNRESMSVLRIGPRVEDTRIYLLRFRRVQALTPNQRV